MKKIMTVGTLGDVFCIGLKLLNSGEYFHILHKTVHTQFHPQIKEIYSLFPNIKKVEFVDKFDPDVKVMDGLPEENMEWFPDINLKEFEEIYPYIILQCHAGRNDAMARKIPIEIVEKIISHFKPEVEVILLGTDPDYEHIQNCINLVGKTSIISAFNFIYNSSGFIGPEGCLAFVSLSLKKDSIIFYVRMQPVEARLLNNPWEQYIIDFIRIGEETR